jgi:L-tartrate/succinate antiporter
VSRADHEVAGGVRPGGLRKEAAVTLRCGIAPGVRRAAAPLICVLGVWLIPPPSGLPVAAWRYLGIFVGAIAGLITEPVPGPVVGLLAVTLAAALRLVGATPADSVQWALSGFSHGTVWLIFVAFMLGLGYEKTGLGRRLALLLVQRLGRRTLGLGYAVALADLALAPFIPSNTARSGGTIFPIIKSIPGLYGTSPEHDPRRVGAYVMWTAFAVTGVTSSMFLTANAANLFAVALLEQTAQVRVSWTGWAMGFLPVGILLFLTLPPLVYLVYPPGLKASDEVPVWAARELAGMGRLTPKELTMAAVATLALGLWVFAGSWLNPTTTALIALCLMLLTGVLDWSDVLADQDAWRVLVWFATLVTLAEGLNQVGFLHWFATRTSTALSVIPIIGIVFLFVTTFFIAHYLFASLTAHATALLTVFLATAATIPGMPMRPLALALCYAVGLMGVLTPYATGPAPIYFGSGYVSRRDFWRLGSIFGAIFLAGLLSVGVPYLLALAP